MKRDSEDAWERIKSLSPLYIISVQYNYLEISNKSSIK